MSKKPAIFLDRDGTLTVNHGVTVEKKNLKLQKGAAQSIRFLNNNGFAVVVITNQGAVARGEITEKGLHSLHNHLQNQLRKEGAFIDAFYHCPHSHDFNRVKVKKYAVLCDCRKPKDGMLRLAAKELNLDLKKSFMVGDMSVDIAAGRSAGTKTVLVQTGHQGNDGKVARIRPDFFVKSIAELPRLIKRLNKKTRS